MSTTREVSRGFASAALPYVVVGGVLVGLYLFRDKIKNWVVGGITHTITDPITDALEPAATVIQTPIVPSYDIPGAGSTPNIDAVYLANTLNPLTSIPNALATIINMLKNDDAPAASGPSMTVADLNGAPPAAWTPTPLEQTFAAKVEAAKTYVWMDEYGGIHRTTTALPFTVPEGATLIPEGVSISGLPGATGSQTEANLTANRTLYNALPTSYADIAHLDINPDRWGDDYALGGGRFLSINPDSWGITNRSPEMLQKYGSFGYPERSYGGSSAAVWHNNDFLSALQQAGINDWRYKH